MGRGQLFDLGALALARASLAGLSADAGAEALAGTALAGVFATGLAEAGLALATTLEAGGAAVRVRDAGAEATTLLKQPALRENHVTNIRNAGVRPAVADMDKARRAVHHGALADA